MLEKCLSISELGVNKRANFAPPGGFLKIWSINFLTLSTL